MKHIAIYVRVSSDKQSTASQQPDLTRWVEANAGDAPVVWYHDSFTGTTMDRPGWRDVERALLTRDVTKIVIWRLDRLGRTCSGMTKLFDELVALKVPLVSIMEHIDLSTTSGRLMANVIASFAQWETECRSERVRAGIARARADGKRWGGSQPGSRRISETKMQVARQMRDEGHPVKQIADTLGVSRQWVYTLLADAS